MSAMGARLIIFVSCWSFSLAMYFQIAEKEEACLIEDIPSDVLVTGRYKIQKWDMHKHEFLPSAPGLGMFVTVKAPNAEVRFNGGPVKTIQDVCFAFLMYRSGQSPISPGVLLSKLYGPDGKFMFTSHSPGEHTICIQSNSTILISFGANKLRVHFDIQVGEHPLDYVVVDAKDKVKHVSNNVEHLMGEVNHILRVQEYQRQREEQYRQKSEDTNSNVLWWAIAQTVILTSVGIWQIKCFKDFLIAKKVV